MRWKPESLWLSKTALLFLRRVLQDLGKGSGWKKKKKTKHFSQVLTEAVSEELQNLPKLQKLAVV